MTWVIAVSMAAAMLGGAASVAAQETNSSSALDILDDIPISVHWGGAEVVASGFDFSCGGMRYQLVLSENHRAGLESLHVTVNSFETPYGSIQDSDLKEMRRQLSALHVVAYARLFCGPAGDRVMLTVSGQSLAPGGPTHINFVFADGRLE